MHEDGMTTVAHDLCAAFETLHLDEDPLDPAGEYFTGQTLLEYLETVPLGQDVAGRPFRLPIQRVIRPDQDYRGFAGQIASGAVWPGDRVVALPSGRTSRAAA